MRESGEKTKIVLLTGCTGMVGTQFVERYGHLYQIIGVARHAPLAGSRTKEKLRDFIEADISSDWENIAKYTLQVHGKVDVLINNAVSISHGPLEAKDMHRFMEELKTNIIAPLALANAALRMFWKANDAGENLSRNRSVINVSSISGIYTDYAGRTVVDADRSTALGLGTYAAEKAALNMLTCHMASEYWKYGVRVNAIAPTTIPHLVSFERVCAEIVELIEGSVSGRVHVLLSHGSFWL